MRDYRGESQFKSEELTALLNAWLTDGEAVVAESRLHDELFLASVASRELGVDIQGLSASPAVPLPAPPVQGEYIPFAWGSPRAAPGALPRDLLAGCVAKADELLALLSKGGAVLQQRPEHRSLLVKMLQLHFDLRAATQVMRDAFPAAAPVKNPV